MVTRIAETFLTNRKLRGTSRHLICSASKHQWKFLTHIILNEEALQSITSTPVVPTGVYPHMPIAVTANSLQHCLSPSKRRNVSHRSATVGQVCHTGLTTVEYVINFSIFDLGGLPLGQRSPKAETTYYPPRSTVLQNFSPIAQTVFEICVTKVFQSLALHVGITTLVCLCRQRDNGNYGANVATVYIVVVKMYWNVECSTAV